MDALLSVGIALAVFAALFYLFEKLFLAPKRRREAEAAPRITEAEVTGFWEDIAAATLPMAKARVEADAPQTPAGSRIGGRPLAIGHDPSWPKSVYDDFPMLLIAQINFAEMPPLDDFPTAGLLQIFSSLDGDRDAQDLAEHERVIRWDPAPATDRVLAVPPEFDDDSRAFRSRFHDGFSRRARLTGLPLTFEAAEAPGNPFTWPFEDRVGAIAWDNRLPENDAVGEMVDAVEDRIARIQKAYGTHWVGGYPNFVQEDPRSLEEYQHLDRVLFHLGFDEDINIGDAGELNVLISRQALRDRAFETAFLTWDCS